MLHLFVVSTLHNSLERTSPECVGSVVAERESIYYIAIHLEICIYICLYIMYIIVCMYNYVYIYDSLLINKQESPWKNNIQVHRLAHLQVLASIVKDPAAQPQMGNELISWPNLANSHCLQQLGLPNCQIALKHVDQSPNSRLASLHWCFPEIVNGSFFAQL